MVFKKGFFITCIYIVFSNCTIKLAYWHIYVNFISFNHENTSFIGLYSTKSICSVLTDNDNKKCKYLKITFMYFFVFCLLLIICLLFASSSKNMQRFKVVYIYFFNFNYMCLCHSISQTLLFIVWNTIYINVTYICAVDVNAYNFLILMRSCDMLIIKIQLSNAVYH